MSRLWKYWPGGECPNCGSCLEILTTCEGEGWGMDGDELRCSDSKAHVGSLDVIDVDCVSENYSHEIDCQPQEGE